VLIVKKMRRMIVRRKHHLWFLRKNLQLKHQHQFPRKVGDEVPRRIRGGVR